jgi:small redox-active disulfide protein 2
MKLIQILGTGCPKCEKLKKNAEEAVKLAGAEALVEKITDIGQITSFGVMMTPAIAIDGEVKASGKVLSPEDIKKWLVAGG